LRLTRDSACFLSFVPSPAGAGSAGKKLEDRKHGFSGVSRLDFPIAAGQKAANQWRIEKPQASGECASSEWGRRRPLYSTFTEFF
jgi:hypothetical protein